MYALKLVLKDDAVSNECVGGVQMASVAERFGMSIQRLIDLNVDLASVTDDNFIVDGQEKVLSTCMQPHDRLTPIPTPPPPYSVIAFSIP